MDGSDPGIVPSLPRILAVGRYDFDGATGRGESAAGGAVQLCAGGDPYAAGDCARGGAAAEGEACCGSCGTAAGLAWKRGGSDAGDGVVVLCRVGCAALA